VLSPDALATGALLVIDMGGIVAIVVLNPVLLRLRLRGEWPALPARGIGALVVVALGIVHVFGGTEALSSLGILASGYFIGQQGARADGRNGRGKETTASRFRRPANIRGSRRPRR